MITRRHEILIDLARNPIHRLRGLDELRLILENTLFIKIFIVYLQYIKHSKI